MSNFKHSVRVRFRIGFRVRFSLTFNHNHTQRVHFTPTKLKVNSDFENNIIMAPSTEYHQRSHSRGIAIFSYPSPR